MEYGFMSGESATVRMLSRLLAALPKDSPDPASGEVARANEGERGLVDPDPETEKRLLRESTPFGDRGDDGRERVLGGFGVTQTSSLLDPFCCGLFVSSAEPKDGLTGEGSIPCLRMESITSKSPRGSGTPDELDGIPKPARTDLQDKVAMRKVKKACKRSSICAPLAKHGVLNRVDPILRLIRVYNLQHHHRQTIFLAVQLPPQSTDVDAAHTHNATSPADVLVIDEHDAAFVYFETF